ncbi:MAG: hypothetical protein OEV73_00240 [Desulfobulbaceae bacterium]|nr:hypothetical protein [Desulfobulbaceae bacterium]
MAEVIATQDFVISGVAITGPDTWAVALGPGATAPIIEAHRDLICGEPEVGKVITVVMPCAIGIRDQM